MVNTFIFTLRDNKVGDTWTRPFMGKTFETALNKCKANYRTSLSKGLCTIVGAKDIQGVDYTKFINR